MNETGAGGRQEPSPAVNGRPHNRRRAADDLLAAALAAGQTLAEAGAAAGVSESTAARRMADPAFRAKVARLRDGIVTRAVAKAGDALAGTAELAVRLLTSEDERVALAAARLLLDITLRGREAADLSERVARLEQSLMGEGACPRT